MQLHWHVSPSTTGVLPTTKPHFTHGFRRSWSSGRPRRSSRWPRWASSNPARPPKRRTWASPRTAASWERKRERGVRRDNGAPRLRGREGQGPTSDCSRKPACRRRTPARWGPPHLGLPAALTSRTCPLGPHRRRPSAAAAATAPTAPPPWQRPAAIPAPRGP